MSAATATRNQWGGGPTDTTPWTVQTALVSSPTRTFVRPHPRSRNRGKCGIDGVIEANMRSGHLEVVLRGQSVNGGGENNIDTWSCDTANKNIIIINVKKQPNNESILSHWWVRVLLKNQFDGKIVGMTPFAALVIPTTLTSVVVAAISTSILVFISMAIVVKGVHQLSPADRSPIIVGGSDQGRLLVRGGTSGGCTQGGFTRRSPSSPSTTHTRTQ